MEVHGYSVFPQAFCNLRRKLTSSDWFINYKAIAALNDDLLKLLPKNDFVYEEDINESQWSKLEDDGWEVISQNVTKLLTC